MRYFAYDPVTPYGLGDKDKNGQVVRAIVVDCENRSEKYFTGDGKEIAVADLAILEAVQQELAEMSEAHMWIWG